MWSIAPRAASRVRRPRRRCRALGFPVPFAERVRKEADIASMAVGIILEAQQAEAILENGQADLIAIGRQS